MTEQGPLLDVSGTPAPSIRTPRGSALGGQIIPQLSLDDLPSTRILKYSKRMEPLRPIERHLHVVQPSQAMLMQLTPNQQQDDLSELPKYKFQMRGSSAGTKSSASASKSHSPSMLERRTSGRHIVEFAAAQTRQQELAQNEAKAQDVDRDETSSPIKQHPPPFDEGLEKHHAYEFVKRAPVESRQGSAASVRIRSARKKYTPTTETGHSIPYVPTTSKHNFVVPPSTSDYVQVKAKERTSLLPSSHQQRPTQQQQQQAIQPQGKAKPLSLHSAAVSPHVNGLDGLNRITQINSQASDYKSSESEQKLIQEEMTSTMQSITEITESLLDPSQRASLSPTTGNFVEHFVKKTEAEISDIAAELQQQLHNVQHEDSSLPASSDSPTEGQPVDYEKNLTQGSSDTSGDVAYNTGPAIVPKKATKIIETEDGQSTVVTTYGTQFGNKVNGCYDMPSGRTVQKRHDALGKELFDKDRTMTTVGNSSRICRGNNRHGAEWLVDPEISHVSLASVSQQQPAAQSFLGGKQRPSGAEDGSSNGSHRDNATKSEADAAIDGVMDDHNAGRADLSHSSGPTKRMASSPTKISLMISRGHQREHNASGNQFHAYPLTRQPRPPVLRSMPKRR